jgi:c-di-GMP-related signal transduction protein
MERVDNKLLDVIKSDIPRYIQGSSNLNLNIETILSEDFLEFHKMVKSLGNISMVIDINLADIFLDLASFNYANGFLKELGYKTCLDGIDDYSFINIDRRSLDFDLIKLTWNSDNENQIDLLTMKDFVQKCNPNRIILTNCDEQEAIHYGHNLGLFLFQGWFLEKLYQNELSVKHNII